MSLHWLECSHSRDTTIPAGASSNKPSHKAVWQHIIEAYWQRFVSSCSKFLKLNWKTLVQYGYSMEIKQFPSMFCILLLIVCMCDTCLWWHDLGVGAVDFDSCVETGLVVALYHISAVCVLSSHTAVIRPWRSVTCKTNNLVKKYMCLCMNYYCQGNKYFHQISYRIYNQCT